MKKQKKVKKGYHMMSSGMMMKDIKMKKMMKKAKKGKMNYS